MTGIGSLGHWLVVLAVVLLLFGTKKLRNLGSDLGSAIRGFKDAMNNPEQANDAEQSKLQHERKAEQPTTTPDKERQSS